MRRNGDWASLTFVIVASLTALALAAATASRGQAPGAASATPAPGAWPAYPEVPHPSGWLGWTWVKSGPSGPSQGKPAGVHHIYANALALEGYRTGRWPDGAVLVFDVVEADAPPGPGLDPSRRLRTDVMVRDQARWAATGGWGYASWLEPERKPNAAVRADPVRTCHACHLAAHPDDFVFTTLEH